MSPSVKVSLRVLTPLFMNDVRPEPNAEPVDHALLRPSSIKPVMRYWFRVLAAGITSDLSSVRALETRVLGNADDGIGQRLLIRPLGRVPPHKPDSHGYPLGTERNKDAGIKYAEFGRIPRKTAHFEPHIPPCVAWGLVLTIAPGAGEAALPIAVDSLLVASVLGGFGGRSRHGFGSVAISGLETKDWAQAPDWVLPWNAGDLAGVQECLRATVQAVRARLATMLGDAPPGSCADVIHISLDSSIYLWSDSWSRDQWPAAIDDVFELPRRYRTEKDPFGGTNWSEGTPLKNWLKGNGNPPEQLRGTGFGLPWTYRSNSVANHFAKQAGFSNAKGFRDELAKAERAARSPHATQDDHARAENLRQARRKMDQGCQVIFNAFVRPDMHGEDSRKLRRASPLVTSFLAFANGEQLGCTLTPLKGRFLDDAHFIRGTRNVDGWKMGPCIPNAGRIIADYLAFLAGGNQQVITEVKL